MNEACSKDTPSQAAMSVGVNRGSVLRNEVKKDYIVRSVSPVFGGSVFLAGKQVQTTICSGIRYVHKTRKELNAIHIQEYGIE